MRVAIRADATVELGTGHVFRCLTLADELKRAGAAVSFASRELPEALANEIRQRGHFVLPPRDSELRGSDWDWVVVDHYGVDEAWEKGVRSRACRLAVIDDLADRRHDCDVLLDQNFHENPAARYETLVSRDCTRLLGPRYALLRPQFLSTRKSLRERSGEVERILVSVGGSDATNETSKVLKALKGWGSSAPAVDLVLGPVNPHLQEVRELAAGLHGVAVHEQVTNMATLMARADLAIGAGGTSTWERCYLGLPTLTIVVAENQRAGTAALVKAGLARSLGWHAQVTPESIASGVKDAIVATDELRAMSRRLLELMPAIEGQLPVVRALLELQNAGRA